MESIVPAPVPPPDFTLAKLRAGFGHEPQPTRSAEVTSC